MNFRNLSLRLKGHLVGVLLIVFFISEAYGKYDILYWGGKSEIPRILKFVFMILLSLAILKNRPKDFLWPVLLTFSFTIGQWYLFEGFNTEVIVSFGKFLFLIMLSLYFNAHTLDADTQKTLLEVFELLIVINSLLVIAGLLFDISFFQTYLFGRFGYNGLFIASYTASYVYIIALFYFLLTFREGFLKNWKVRLVIVAVILLGTKSAYIGLFATMLVYVFFYLKLAPIKKKIMATGISLIVIGIAYFFFFENGIFHELRQEKGMVTSLLSLRDELFLERTLPFVQSQWSGINYLFGGLSDLTTRSQMGIVDLFYFWGFLGGCLFLWVFYRTYFTFQITKADLFLILTLSIIVGLAGNFFENASIAIYLIVLREAILFKNHNLNVK